MRVIAVICEYNPFHEGHQYLLKQARALFEGEQTALVCIMSGDFVQRGEPAVFDKYARAKSALEGGADLVLELPAPYSCSVAEHFAAAGVSIAHRLGVVDELCFGSEGKDEKDLLDIALRLESPAFAQALEKERQRDRSLSYPKRLDSAYLALYGQPPALSSNEILGVRYLTSLKKEGASIIPHALPMLEGVCASRIRQSLREEQAPVATLERGECAILAMLDLWGKDDRFSRNARYCESLKQLFERVRTANDTDARLKRELLFTLFDLPEDYEKTPPAFTVLLGANERGRALLSEIGKKGSIPVVSKQSAGGKEIGAPFEDYLRLQRLYALFLKDRPRANFLFEKRPVIL